MLLGRQARVLTRNLRILGRIEISVYLGTASAMMILSRATADNLLRSIRCILAITRTMRRYNRNARILYNATRRRRI